MKIYIRCALKNPLTLSGKGLFCNRLAAALSVLGVEMTEDRKAKVDVSINVSRMENTNARLKIIRMDGIYHNTGQNYRGKNRGISENVHSADAVIYQGRFCKSMADRYIGKFKGPSRIIPNGADSSFYENIVPSPPDQKKVFFAFARWRPQKRLQEIVACFRHARVPDSVLFVAGKLEKSQILKSELKAMFRGNVKYLGVLNEIRIGYYLKMARASIHLSWVDWCPNSVVEAIAAGVPVICNNVGGTQELVRPSGGYVCDIDEEYDLSPIDLYHPPKIDRNRIAEAIIKCAIDRPKITSDHVNIRNIAGQYLSFIKELL